MKNDNVWLTALEAQKYLRCSHNTLNAWIRKGLPYYTPGRVRLFKRDDLDAWITAHPGGSNLTNTPRRNLSDCFAAGAFTEKNDGVD